MNILICGKPGDGKGRVTAGLTVEELRLDKRPIITNFAVKKFPWVTKKHRPRRGLVSYLEEKYNDDFNCVERIFILNSKAIQNFYLYRALNRKQIEKLASAHLVGYRKVTPEDEVMDEEEFRVHLDYQLFVCDHEVTVDKAGRTHCVEFNAVLLEHSGGHLNIADECWRFWPARGWQHTSQADVYYNAQHRHFSDDNFFLTQRDNDIDSIIVDRCQETHVMKNLSRFPLGIWRGPGVFTKTVYDGRPMPSKTALRPPEFIRLDVNGLAQTYDTSAGVGISGRGEADVASRKIKGLPFWSLPLVVVGGIGALAFGVNSCRHHIPDLLPGHHGSKTANSSAPNNPLTKPVVGVSSEAVQSAAANQAERLGVQTELGGSPEETNDVWCVGYIIWQQVPTVYLSDGTTAYGDDGEVQKIEKHWVVCFGRRYRIQVGHTESGFSVPSQDYQGVGDVALTAPPRPVNDARILPAIHSHSEGGYSGPILGKFTSLNPSSLPESSVAPSPVSP